MKKISFALALAGLFALFATRSGAVTITENFSTNPLQNGWQIFGDTNLFQWNSTNQNLAVTWDSSQNNSYFYKPLGNILAMDDDFSIAFDLQLSDVEASGSFQLAIGLFNFAEATNADFSRAAGDTPNLFEFDYFPDGGYGPSIDTSLADMTVNITNESDFDFNYDDLPLNIGITYHIILTHTAGSPIISAEVLTNGQIYTSLPFSYAGPITDFRLDTLSISSYSTNGDTYTDSILAHGTVDNFVVTIPPPPVQNPAVVLSNGVPQIQFSGRTNWIYTLQRTADFQTWTNISLATSGESGTLFLSDTNALADKAFYRVNAARP